MLTRQINVRKEVLFQVDFYVWVGKVGKVGLSRVELGSQFPENCFGLMLTRQTNVGKEVLFQVDFSGWVGKVG